MKRAIYPGSFDPVTLGHMDIIMRSSRMVDELVVGVLNNKSKNPLFTIEERMKLLNRAVSHISNIRIATFSGLLIDFAKAEKADMIIRGLRAITDFEYELQMAQTNHILSPDIDTLFLTTAVEYSYLSSSTVKEIASYGGDITRFVPGFVADSIKNKFGDAFKEEKHE